MDKETLRMQMLAGVITEGQYKEKLQENIHDLTPFHKGSHSTGRPDFNKMTADEIEDYLEKDKDNPGGLYGRSLSIVKHILDKKRKEETEKNSLNEHAIGGIVGIGAINQIPSRAKADYEDAFEHFLGERYEVKPNRERDDIEDINEEEVEEEVNEGLPDSDNIDELIEMLELYISNLKELKITGPTEEQDFGSLVNALEEEIRAFN